MPLKIREDTDAILFSVFVQPRASRIEAAGVYRDALKIRLTAPPVEGKANKQCTEFLAKSLKVPKSSVQIVSGQTGRTKTVRIFLPGGAEGSAAARSGLRQAIIDLAGE